VALGLYEGQLARWVRALKYENSPGLARPLGGLLALVVAGALGCAADAVVVPVPLDPRRRVERGYNQAALLAGSLAASLGLAVLPDALARREGTAAQATLDRQARLRNLRDAFVPGPGWPGRRLHGREVLLVDDVLTTGATIQACAEAILRAGAGRVFACVVAAGVPRRLWG